MFIINSKFIEYISIVNHINVQKLEKLLHEIDTPIDNDQDMISLSRTVGLRPLQLEKVLLLSEYIFEQARLKGMSSNQLISYLKSPEYGVNEELANVFGRVFDSKMQKTEIREEYNKRSEIGFANQVEQVDYDLNLNLSHSNYSQRRTCDALLHFSFTNNEKETIEFEHKDLSNFFESLEKIQIQLDKYIS